MLGVLLVFSNFFWYPPNYNVTFKITVEFKIIIIDFYSVGDYKNHITVRRIPEEH
jgi:hypothetical protein